MNTGDYIALKRDVQAIAIPSGQDVTLYAGTEVRITQALGGTFTVITHMSQLASIAGRDADALGKEIPAEARDEETLPAEKATKGDVEKQVWKKLKTCFDPEIPHNIVDLGLVYGCEIAPLEEGFKVEVRMTLTAPGCGMGDVLTRDARQKIETIPGVREARVDLVFEPAWSPARMNPALRREFF